MKKEVEQQGLKLSITAGGTEGESKVVTSCKYLEEEWRECSTREGVVMAESVETLGVNLRTQIKESAM